MKNKNKIAKIILSTMLLMLSTACESILEIEPVSQIPGSAFWNNNDDANLGVVAIYDAMQETYKKNRFYWGEFRSDNYVVAGQPNAVYESLIINNLTPDYNDYLNWDKLYSMIFRANLAIDKIPTIPSYDKNLLGEAHVLRAYAYFDAYKLWGGVPLFIKPTLVLNSDSYKERATAQEVLDLVLSDLQKAALLITQTTNSYRFSKASLFAFEAKVKMYLKEYQGANDALDALIALDQYALTTDRESWRNLFVNDMNNFPDQGQEGPELILSLNFDLATDGAGASGIYSLFFKGVQNYWIAPTVQNKWLEKFPTNQIEWEAKYPGIPPHTENGVDYYGDWRYHETVTEGGGGPQDLRVSKYNKESYSSSIDDTNIILFRYADMLLLKAEAENMLENGQEAIDLVNKIRVARELPTVLLADYTTKEARENLILDERQLELFAEGTRWWDLVRTEKAVEILGAINGQTEETIIWPIYFRHLIDNNKLEQNEVYR